MKILQRHLFLLAVVVLLQRTLAINTEPSTSIEEFTEFAKAGCECSCDCKEDEDNCDCSCECPHLDPNSMLTRGIPSYIADDRDEEGLKVVWLMSFPNRCVSVRGLSSKEPTNLVLRPYRVFCHRLLILCVLIFTVELRSLCTWCVR
jgi:hypothetical protein